MTIKTLIYYVFFQFRSLASYWARGCTFLDNSYKAQGCEQIPALGAVSALRGVGTRHALAGCAFCRSFVLAMSP